MKEELFFQTFIDDYTRMTVIILMREMSQIIGNLELYFSFMRNKGFSVQIFRKYQGTEYSSIEIKNYFDINGIYHEISGRVVHTQMHVAERMNHTKTEMEITMLIDAGLT